MQSSLSPLSACYEVFIRPNAVFAKLDNTHNWSWVAFFFVMLFSALPIYAYLQFVDFDWYVNMLAESAGQMSPAEKDNMRAMLSQDSVLWSAVIATLLAQTIANALIAAYLHISTKSDEQSVKGFTDWYGFTWWISLPVVISCIASVLVITLSTNNQLTAAELNPLALPYWLVLEMNSKWFGIASVIKPDLFLTVYLALVGLSQWTSFAMSKIYAIVLAPVAALLIVWLFFLMV